MGNPANRNGATPLTYDLVADKALNFICGSVSPRPKPIGQWRGIRPLATIQSHASVGHWPTGKAAAFLMPNPC